MFTFNDHSYDSTTHRAKINASNNMKMKVNLNKNSFTQRNNNNMNLLIEVFIEQIIIQVMKMNSLETC
jgi:hypothetical protein